MTEKLVRELVTFWKLNDINISEKPWTSQMISDFERMCKNKYSIFNIYAVFFFQVQKYHSLEN